MPGTGIKCRRNRKGTAGPGTTREAPEHAQAEPGQAGLSAGHAHSAGLRALELVHDTFQRRAQLSEDEVLRRAIKVIVGFAQDNLLALLVLLSASLGDSHPVVVYAP